MKEVVFTSFGAFREIAANPSILVAKRAADLVAAAGCRVELFELPVTFAAAASFPGRPSAAGLRVHVGVAASRATVTVERWGRPESGQEPDTAGCLGPTAPDGATPRRSAPAEALVEALCLEGEAASLSDDAGGYVCNALLYASLRSDGQACFVHVPLLSEADAEETGRRLGRAVVRLVLGV